MKIPPDKVAWLGAEALKRIKEAPLSDQQRFLLGECVQAYLPLDEMQQAEFEKLAVSEPYKGVLAMNTTWYEKGIEKGIERGKRSILLQQLEDRFGPLSTQVQEKVEQLTADGLRAVVRCRHRCGKRWSN